MPLYYGENNIGSIVMPSSVGGGNTGTIVNSIPDYWMATLDKGAEKINTVLTNAGFNKSSFMFYSDAHWDKGSMIAPSLLKYLWLNTGLKRTIFGGDIVATEGTDYDTMSYLWEWRSQIKELPNHHSVVGNHDDGNTTNNLFSEKYVYAFLMASEESNDVVRGNGLYYYIDDKCEKTRYLFLDTAYEGLSNLSNEQTSFITNTLTSTPHGWHIVVVSHIWYLPDYSQYDKRPVPLAGMSVPATTVCTILDNYNARSGDFANCGATVEFCIGGHVHYDYVAKTNGGIPIILCETASLTVRGSYTGSANTTTETAVSGVVADYDNDKVAVIRVGRGRSFEVNISTGEVTEWDDEEIGSGSDTPNVPAYTNVLETVGYTEGYRLSGGNGEPKANEGTDISGFIPFNSGDYLYLKNVAWVYDTTDYTGFVGFYDSNKSHIGGYNLDTSIDQEDHECELDDNGYIIKIRFIKNGLAYIRISAANIDDTSIITVNEPIK